MLLFSIFFISTKKRNNWERKVNVERKSKDNTGDEVRSNKWGGREKENRKQPLKTKQEKKVIFV